MSTKKIDTESEYSNLSVFVDPNKIYHVTNEETEEINVVNDNGEIITQLKVCKDCGNLQFYERECSAGLTCWDIECTKIKGWLLWNWIDPKKKKICSICNRQFMNDKYDCCSMKCQNEKNFAKKLKKLRKFEKKVQKESKSESSPNPTKSISNSSFPTLNSTNECKKKQNSDGSSSPSENNTTITMTTVVNNVNNSAESPMKKNDKKEDFKSLTESPKTRNSNEIILKCHFCKNILNNFKLECYVVCDIAESKRSTISYFFCSQECKKNWLDKI